LSQPGPHVLEGFLAASQSKAGDRRDGLPGAIIDRRTQAPRHNYNSCPTTSCRQDPGNVRLIISDDGFEPDFNTDRGQCVCNEQRIAVGPSTHQQF
jgi:hypothetical protein